MVVAISGRVGSETPINCEFSGLRGVIVEETVRRYNILKSMNNFHFIRTFLISFQPFAINIELIL